MRANNLFIMADLDYNTLSNQLFRPETIEAMMLPPLDAENSSAEPTPASPLPDELPILPLRGVVDPLDVRRRLEKDLAKVEKELAQVNKKLENPDFWQKAAQAVIDKEEAKARALNERFDILEAALKKL